MQELPSQIEHNYENFNSELDNNRVSQANLMGKPIKYGQHF